MAPTLLPRAVMNPSSRWWVLAVFLAACGDPNGASATGAVLISGGAPVTGWQRLELRACPADAGVAPACLGTASAPLERASLSPGDGGTRHPYSMRIYRGFTTAVKDWRLVAWLSQSTDAGDLPAAGEWWGVTTVSVPEYNGGYYSGLASGDVTIDLQQP